MKRARSASGALAAIDADYVPFALGRAPSPQAAPAVARSITAVHAAMRPWAARQAYLNLAETGRDPGQLLDSAGLRPAPPRQGRGRPGQPDPLQPPHPARLNPRRNPVMNTRTPPLTRKDD
jgi:hypothetical protein